MHSIYAANASPANASLPNSNRSCCTISAEIPERRPAHIQSTCHIPGTAPPTEGTKYRIRQPPCKNGKQQIPEYIFQYDFTDILNPSL